MNGVTVDMNSQFWSGFAVALVALVGVSAYAYWGSTIVEHPQDDIVVMEPVVAQFTDTLRAKFVEEKGQPIEGFEPWMFMEVYPGLKASDFNNVDALIGIYRHQNGEVVYDLNGELELHSAARAISDEGMSQLLYNIAVRLNIDLAGDLADDDASGSLRQIFTALQSGSTSTPPQATPQSGQVSVEGTIVCLPHKGSGPTTMECAYGLRAQDGTHYGLRNLFVGAWPWPLDVGDRARIEGSLSAPPANEKYDITGYIDVVEFEKL